MQRPSPEAYVDSLYPEDPDLARVQAGIRARKMPEISVRPGYGRLLTLLVRLSGARRALEIGALGGYSGICLARGLPAGGRLVSLELDPEYAGVAREHLVAAGLGDRVEYRVGPALESLAALYRAGERFDFFFIDADKENYPNYLDWALRLANPGAVIVGDNILMQGESLDPGITDPDVGAMRRFNARVATDPRLESALLPGYDGLAIARVR